MTPGGNPPVALTIAGSDSGSGAGLQADIKTMAALGVFATTAVTAVTAQNTAEVREVHHVPVGMVTAQIRAVIDDLPVAAVKTGLLGTAAVVGAVGGLAAAGHLPRLVVDPVMVASTGRALVADRCVEAYRRRLLPYALLVTPNLWEAALLAGLPASGVGDLDTMVEAARRIHRLGPTWVLVKGGHLPGVETGSTADVPTVVADVLFDGREVTVLDGPLVVTRNNHGTGCSLSAAVAAHLARGADVPTAVAAAKTFVHDALLGGATWNLGQGHGPLDHLGWSGGAPAGITGRG
ncbi:MAG: bifunctional hydroxymethylpyrimidine kinase/phosphomethylpyrimidine kinase [Acidimicrobiales bacterium]|jgi:hydroxymethylpyrimidine/phosphomethylpyrimidine kinase